jgi:hypothetical protein
MIPPRRCGSVLALAALSIAWNTDSIHAQILAKPKGNSILLVGDFDDPTGYRAAVPMASDDGSTAGVCTVDISPDYDFNHYQPAPKPSRIDIEITVKNPTTPGYWLPALTSAPTGPLIYTIAGTVGENHAVEIVSFTSDNPAEIPHTVNEFDDEIVQIAAQPSDRFVWVHTVDSDDPSMFRLESYSIDPTNPVMDQTSQVFSAEMEGSLVPGTLVATQFGKAFALVEGSPSISDGSPGLLAAGFQGSAIVTALEGSSPIVGISLDAKATGTSPSNANYHVAALYESFSGKQAGGEATLVGYEFGATGTADFVGSAVLSNSGGQAVVAIVGESNAKAFAPYGGNSVGVFDYDGIASGGTLQTVSLDEIVNIFSKDPGPINNITLSSDGHTIGLTTQSNPGSANTPAFFHFDANNPTEVNRNADGTMVFYYDLTNTGAEPLLNGEPVNQFGLSLTDNTALVVGDNSTHPTEPPRMLAIGYNTPEGFLDPTLVSFKLTGLQSSPGPTLTPTVGQTNTPAPPTNTPMPEDTNTPLPEDTNTPTETETPGSEETDTPTHTETPLPEGTNTPTVPDVETPDLNVSVAIDLSVNVGEGEGTDYVSVFLTDQQEEAAGVCIIAITDVYSDEHYEQVPPFVNGVRVPNDFITDIPLNVTNLNPDSSGITWYAEPTLPTAVVYAGGNIRPNTGTRVIEAVPFTSNDPSQLQSEFEEYESAVRAWAASDGQWYHIAETGQTPGVDDYKFTVRSYDLSGGFNFNETNSFTIDLNGPVTDVELAAAGESDVVVAAVQSINEAEQTVDTMLLLARATQPVTATLFVNDVEQGNLNLAADCYVEEGKTVVDVGLTYSCSIRKGTEEPCPQLDIFGVPIESSTVDFPLPVHIPLDFEPLPNGLEIFADKTQDPPVRRGAVIMSEEERLAFIDFISSTSLCIPLHVIADVLDQSPGTFNNIAKSPDGNTVGVTTKSNPDTGDPPGFARLDPGFKKDGLGRKQITVGGKYFSLDNGSGGSLLNGTGEPLDGNGLVITNDTAFILSDNTIASNDAPNVVAVGFDTPQDFTGNTIVTIDLGKNDEAFPEETPTPCPTPGAETPTPTDTPTIPIADHPEFDVDGSGKIDANDLMIFMKDWMKCVPENGR